MFKNTKLKLIFLSSIILVLAFLSYRIVLSLDKEPGYIEGSGTVEGTSVIVSSVLAGKILELPIAEGDVVKKGQILAKLEAKQIEAKVKQSEAQLALAKSQVKQAQLRVNFSQEEARSKIAEAAAAVEIAEANLKQLQIAYDDAKRYYEKASTLVAGGALPKQQYEQAESAMNIAEAQLEGAQNQLSQAKSLLALANSSPFNLKTPTGRTPQETLSPQGQALLEAALAQQKLAENLLAEAKAIYEDTQLKAPLSGTVTLKTVNQGELVNQGTAIAEITDTSNLFVTIYVAENEIGKIRLNQEAQLKIDSDPDRSFSGKVVYISDKAEFTPKNAHTQEDRVKLVYGVKINIDDTKGIIKPGMLVDAVLQ